MRKHLVIAIATIAIAASSVGATELKGPRYSDLPEAALDGMEGGPYAYFQSRAVNLWRYSFLNDTGGKDYTLAATVRVLDPAPLKGFRPGEGCIFMNYQWGREAIGSDAGLIVRYTDADNYYQVRLSTGYGHVELWKTHGGVVRVRPFAFQANKDYRVAVTASGPWIVVSVDGQELIRYADPVEPLLTGKAGLAVRESRVRFSDVTVTNAAAIPDAVPAHKPDFHIRQWVGRDYIFDGDEPVGHIPASRDRFEELKLRPGLMPVIIAQSGPTLWGVGFDKLKWSDKGKMEVLAEGNELQLTLGSVEMNGIAQPSGKWRLSYDAKRNSYVLDGVLSADVLKEGILSKWGSICLTDPMFYQLLAPATDAMPACRSYDNAAIVLRDDDVVCSFPLNHAGKNNGFAPAKDLAIKPGGYWVTVVDGWGVVTEIPDDNSIRYYGDYCEWGLDQHITPLWKPDQVSYSGAPLEEFPAKAGDRFEGHIRYRLWDRQEVAGAIARAVRPTSGKNAGPDRPLIAHVEPVNDCATILPLVNGTSRLMWQGDYEMVRDAGRNDRHCLRLQGGKSAKLINIGPSFRAGPYLAKMYRIGAWVRSRDFHGTIRCAIDSAAGPKPLADPKPLAELKCDGAGDWAWLGFETAVPHQTFFFTLSFQATGTGSVDLDDITLEPRGAK